MTTDLPIDATEVADRPMGDAPSDEIEALATQLRIRSITMADRADSGHPTSAMSAADLVAVLMVRHLRLDPARPDDLGNDRLIFSKGHASPLLYAALDAMGIIDDVLGGDDLTDVYRQRSSLLEGHPTPRIPGVPAATGSLGLGLSIGAGIATAHRLSGAPDARVWVLCGDSELAEGSNWEAIEHAASAELSGLIAIVDVNRLGQTGPTRHGWDTDAYARRFEAFGWDTITVDGHDLEAIDRAFGTARAATTPTAIIARTVKGRGASETSDASGKHGKPLDDPEAAVDELGRPERSIRVTPATATLVPAPDVGSSDFDLPRWEVGGDPVATRDAFGDALLAIGRSRDDVVVIDGEVKNSTRTAALAEEVPERFVEAYIAEQLMTGLSIGLDAAGWRPVMATFGAFLSRAHDVLRMAAVSRSRITVVGSHAGVSIGEDGPSQMGLEDIAMMRCLAGSTVISPCDANQTAALLPQLLDRDGISYLRTMRGDSPVIHSADTEFWIGGSCVVHTADDAVATILATGATVHEAIDAAQRLGKDGVAVDVIDMYSIKPIDERAILDAASRPAGLVVVEDHRLEGGLGEAVSGVLTAAGSATRMFHLAVREMPGSATPAEQLAIANIDADAIVRAVNDLA